VRIGDCVLDEQGAPAVVTSTRWQGVGGGVVSIALSTHPGRRVFEGRDLVARAVLFGEPGTRRTRCTPFPVATGFIAGWRKSSVQ